MHLIQLDKIIQFDNSVSQFVISYIVQDGDQLLSCKKHCDSSREADTVYQSLAGILNHDNADTTIIIDQSMIENLSQ